MAPTLTELSPLRGPCLLASPCLLATQACGGRASDGVRDILDVEPSGLHDRLPVFVGSAADIAELVAYGDVQQGATAYTE